jgi:hypothetical protein
MEVRRTYIRKGLRESRDPFREKKRGRGAAKT